MSLLRLPVPGAEDLAADGYAYVFIGPLRLRTGPVNAFPDHTVQAIVYFAFQTDGNPGSFFYRLAGDVLQGADRVASGRHSAEQCAAAIQYLVGHADGEWILDQDPLAGFTERGIGVLFIFSHFQMAVSVESDN